MPPTRSPSRSDRHSGAREGRDIALDLGRSRTLSGTHLHPSDGATDWIAANWPMPRQGWHRAGPPRASRRGAISLSSSSHFPLDAVFESETGGVAARTRQAVDKAGADRIGDAEHDRHGAGCLLQWPKSALPVSQDHVRRERDQFGRVLR